MFTFSKPCTVNFAGVTLQREYQLLFSDRLVNKTQGLSIDYRVEDPLYPSSGVSITTALADVVDYIGFNPFREFTLQCTNNGGTYEGLNAGVKLMIEMLAANMEYLPAQSGNHYFTNYRTLDNVQLDGSKFTSPGYITSASNCGYACPSICSGEINSGNTYPRITMILYAIPERAFDHGVIDPLIADNSRQISITMAMDTTDHSIVKTLSITLSTSSFKYALQQIALSHVDDATMESATNPYISGGGVSVTGGGDGSYIDPEETTKIEVPDLPNIDAITSGLVTVYAPTAAQINALGGFLWGVNFDLSNLKKLFADPMSAIIGLSIVPVSPTIGGTRNVKFGDIDTGVAMGYVTNQFVTVDMGSVAVRKEVGCFLDFAPYVGIQIFLPGIGMRTLNPDDCMGQTLTVTYHVDVVSGACIAFISVGNRGVLYEFAGSLITTIPVTAANYSGAIQNAVQMGVSAGMTAVGAMTGVMPLTAAGAMSMAQSGANTAMNSKPQVEHSGNVCGSAGLMGIKKPYLVITRPRKSVPANLNTFTGNCLNMTCKLNTLKGFTMIELIHLDGIPCTAQERDELRKLLAEGVIF